MPNWVYNIVNSDEETISKIKHDFDCEKDASNFTFQKLIPMPKELDIESSSTGNDGLILLYHRLPEEKKRITDEIKEFEVITDEELQEMIMKAYLSLNTFHMREDVLKRKERFLEFCCESEEYSKMLHLGVRYFLNWHRFDECTCYNWRISKWGSKWDACGCAFGDDGKTIMFTTAWDFPAGAMQALTRKYPDAMFEFKYADEGIEENSGNIIAKNGEVINYTLNFDSDQLEEIRGY